MPLVRVTTAFEVVRYNLEIETIPTKVRATEKTQFHFRVFHPKTGEQIKRYNVAFDKPFHLFIIGQDLEYYNHIHPSQQPDGSFTIETALPKAGHYELFCDFSPVGGTPQVIRRDLTTAGFIDDHHFSRIELTADKSLNKSVDGIRFELKLDPAEPVAGQPTILKYYLIDEKTGLPVKDLQPYLGAWGHTVTLSADAADFLHSHPSRLIPPGVDRTKLVSGPQVSFQTFFSRPGYYRVWSQFQRENKVTTVSFTLDVSRLDRIARWDGSGWSPLIGNPINGLDGPVRALAVSGSDVYVGGDFTTIDGLSSSGIARWDGSSWHSLGGGVNGKVWAIAVKGTDVYVGGDFTMAGEMRANGIAKWDGRRWSSLGSGIDGCKEPSCSPSVYALASSGGEVYVGGRFATAGGVPTNGIARWNGYSWSALGTGVCSGNYDGVVKALAVRGSDVYAGGQFIMAGEVTAYNIARWNGHKWAALGSGIRGYLEEVLAIAISLSDVYAGGKFTLAGGVSASNIAKWNGRNWSALDLNIHDGVQKIVANGSSVYVGGGPFTVTQGGVLTTGIVKWDGGNWSALGISDGVYAGPIMAIAMSGKDIYIGGDSFIMPAQKVHTPHQHVQD